MSHKIYFGLCLVVVGLAVACSQTSTPLSPSASPTGVIEANPDGSNLKIAAPTIVSPTGNFQPDPGAPVVFTFRNVSGTFRNFPVTYEIAIRNAGGTLVASTKFAGGGGTNTSVPVAASLAADAPHTWQVRATFGTGVGPWSGTASFRTPVEAFIKGSNVFDPLTNGRTVGIQRGGHFIPGVGWQADSPADGLDYNIDTCSNCRVEFEGTGIDNGLGNFGDHKFMTMGDGATFADFGAFRNHDWKMHWEIRGDGDGTGMKLIWRNGCWDCGEDDPGDHTGKVESTGIDWDEDNVYKFVADWTPTGYFVSVNGEVWFDGDFSEPYAPPNHRISLGCWPRGESIEHSIFRNVKVTKR